MALSERGQALNLGWRARSWAGGAAWGLGLCALTACVLFPLPNLLLDLAIAGSWALAVGFFTLALNAPALSLPRLPQWLLLMTVGRLGLNIATTRAILSEARAGELVSALGELVMGGTWLVGLSFFVTLTLIQLIVISRGAERIAEVSARFALDALPGAQQALTHALDRDAIHPEDARRARRLLRARAELCGSLDGAMRFVKGEALASTLLVVLNALGGLLVGLSQEGGTWSRASEVYLPLTIGDGLVAQLPALLNTVAVATLVSRLPLAYSGERGAEERGLERDVQLSLGAALTSLVVLTVTPGWSLETRLAWLSLTLGLTLYARRARLVGGGARREPLTRASLCLTVHPSALSVVGGAERLSQGLRLCAERLGLPERGVEIKMSRRALIEGGYRLSSGERRLAEGVVLEGRFASFVSPPPEGSLGVIHPLWGLEGWWREARDGWGATSEPSALSQLEVICAHCATARMNDHAVSWTLDEVWARLSEASGSLRSAALKPWLEAVSLTSLFRRLSASGVDLREIEGCLEGVARLSREALSAEHDARLAQLESEARRGLGWERLSGGVRSLSRGFGRAGASGEVSASGLGAELSYVLIDLDCQAQWGEEEWSEVYGLIRSACAVTPDWVVICEPERRVSLERRLRERARGVAVLSWDELPPELSLELLGWVGA